ncbi:hypothetical protein EX895_000186 [Sporisorium graminicola]|uniref:Uncharacterized protein n=1 Tax=Sporisorium graminicola TaxID=280036 RepID=A0A4U7L2U7_9BASI|nr:hypothetical protein EX895_000186 [Sporisorium graminicola]TKY90188.1 hypothetical protein EX895_000186 [Sporisorium graminicola]
MSELFDSLNLTTSAGPSSSQQSSSQPSTSKVFWHASPSPGVLRQLANWTPSKSQDSPTLPLCTQAFVGELKKLPGALEAQSPLVARDSAKRKKQLVDASRATSRHVSDPTANRVKTREYINLETSDNEEDDEEEAQRPRRLLLGDVGESSPESTRRRKMDAGHTGRFRQLSSPSQHSFVATRSPLPFLDATEKDAAHPSISSNRRLDRRPPRRRKKESLIAGLGFTDDSGGATDCMKLFENLQAAIKGMQNASRPNTSGSTESGSAQPEQRHGVTFDSNSNGTATNGVRLTPREGIHRTTSAPSTSRAAPHAKQEMRSQSAQQQHDSTTPMDEPLTPNRIFRSVKSDHDVFRPAEHARVLQSLPINLPPSEPQAQADPTKLAVVSQHSQGNMNAERSLRQPVPATAAATCESPASKPIRGSSTAAQTHANKTSHAVASPVKRSARIEARQQNTSSAKKLGVRGPSSLSKSVSPHNKPAVAANRKVGGPAATSASRPLPLGMSQARQPGLPRNCSQYAPTSQSVAASQHSTHAGPAAPFRPPAIAARVARSVRTPVRGGASKAGQPASSDDSFGDVDDDAAFLALADELEY